MKIRIEIWKRIKIKGKNTNYSISSFGRVRNDKTHLILKLNKIKKGYLHVNIWLNHKQYTKKVHRLVMYAFYKKPLIKKQVNHKDGDKTNNHIWNLEWVTSKENVKHAYKSGLAKGRKGEKHHGCKITNKDAMKICELLVLKYDYKAITKITNIQKSIVKGIKLRRSWKHISKDYKW